VIRLVAAMATVIGLLTGVGTIVGWIASASLRDTVAFTTAVAGAMFLLAFAGMMLVAGIRVVARAPSVRRRLGRLRTPWWLRWHRGWYVAVAVAVPSGILRLVIDPHTPVEWLRSFGWTTLIVAVVALAFSWANVRGTFWSRHKVCPDCAESVRTNAFVCHYCGWRFESPPGTE
jgi:hypothetical protein